MLRAWILLQLSYNRIRNIIEGSVGVFTINNNLDLAHYYRSIGNFDDAVAEYKEVIPDLPVI